MRVISSSSIKFVMGQIKTKIWHADIVFEVTPVVVKQIIPLKAKDLTAANSFGLMLLKKNNHTSKQCFGTGAVCYGWSRSRFLKSSDVPDGAGFLGMQPEQVPNKIQLRNTVSLRRTSYIVVPT